MTSAEIEAEIPQSTMSSNQNGRPDEELTEILPLLCTCCGMPCAVVLVIMLFVLSHYSSYYPPRFRLDNASVSFNTTSNATSSPDQVMVEWSIKFSVFNPNDFIGSTIVYKDLSVSVNYPLGSTTNATIPGGFQQESGNWLTFYTVVFGPLPRLNTSNNFLVMFDVNMQTRTRHFNFLHKSDENEFKLMKVTCNLVKIELQPFQTYGIWDWEGNPVECCDPNKSDSCPS